MPVSFRPLWLVPFIWYLTFSHGELHKSIRPLEQHLGKAEGVSCLAVQTFDGVFVSASSKPGETCGLYFAGEVNTRVLLEFVKFDADCDRGSLVAILDGWEQNMSVFPPISDVPHSERAQRYTTYCGSRSPHIFVSSGNMALVQYRLAPSEVFVVRAKFIEHPSPCNIVVIGADGTVPLSNYGRNRTCSALLINTPQMLHISHLGLELISQDAIKQRQGLQYNPYMLFQLEEHCGSDRVEIYGGFQWSFARMEKMLTQSLCRASAVGTGLKTVFTKPVFCDAIIVRLVSSGRLVNSIAIEHKDLAAAAGTKEKFNHASDGYVCRTYRIPEP